MNKLLSPFIAGLSIALIFIVLHPRLGGWTFVIAAVSFPIIFWLAQAAIDLLGNIFKGEKK